MNQMVISATKVTPRYSRWVPALFLILRQGWKSEVGASAAPNMSPPSELHLAIVLVVLRDFRNRGNDVLLGDCIVHVLQLEAGCLHPSCRVRGVAIGSLDVLARPPCCQRTCGAIHVTTMVFRFTPGRERYFYYVCILNTLSQNVFFVFRETLNKQKIMLSYCFLTLFISGCKGLV